MRKHLFLTGMMGSGKSTLGRLLAKEMGVRFVDLDELIVAREGMSIPEIFAARGEAGFRTCESQALRAICEQEPCVVATGGGAILKDENVSLMRAAGIVVLLNRPLEDMIRDVSAQGRPNLDGDKASRMRTLYAQRSAQYKATCDLAFDNSGAPGAAAMRLLAHPLVEKNKEKVRIILEKDVDKREEV